MSTMFDRAYENSRNVQFGPKIISTAYLIGVTQEFMGRRKIKGYRIELTFGSTKVPLKTPIIEVEGDLVSTRELVHEIRTQMIVELNRSGFRFSLPSRPTQDEWDLFDRLQIKSYVRRPSNSKKAKRMSGARA